MGVDRAIDITAKQRKIVTDLLERHLPNTTAWVYGSRAKWASRPQSDLDLVVFATPKQNGRVSDLREALEESNLPFRVDLFVWDTVPKQFHKHIKRDHVVLVKKEELDTTGEWRETIYGRFAPDFVEDCLANLCDPINGIQTGPFGSQLHKKDYVSVGTPIITVEHLGDNRILYEDAPHVSDHDRDRLSKYILHDGDIVFSRVGSVDRRALVKESESGWLFSGRCLRIRSDPKKIDSGYLSYFFGLPSFKEHIRAIAVGAPMPSLNTQILSDIVVPHPRDLNEQRTIAHILGTLDDKIELNRRMNQTLESMARALFKSWFVDFDPVRAKMEGRDTGLPKHLADLFPDRLVDSELGEIPEGWEVSEIGKEIDAVGGATPSTKEPAYWNEGEQHWATPKDLSKLLSPVLLETNRKITDTGVKKISSGLLPVGTVLLSSRAPIGYLAIAEVPTAINQGFIAMVCEKRLPNLYVLFWCYENLDYIKGISSGSTFAEISKKAFRPVSVAVPSKEVLAVYEDMVRPLYDRIVANTKESVPLVSLRDTLFPQLISGKLRVKTAETFFHRMP